MDDNERWSTGAAGNTLPEHRSALALLRQLDHAWFHDNLLKPRIGLINAFRPSPNPPLSRYQSIELMDAAHSKWVSSTTYHRLSHGGMPCTSFENLPHPKAPNGTQHLSKDGNDDLQAHQKLRKAPLLPAARPHAARLHVSPTPLSDAVLGPPVIMHTRSVKSVKDFQAKRMISGASTLDSIEFGKQFRVSLVNAPLLQPGVRVVGTRKAPRKSSKSMTALEFDELQGPMDLGFQFSQDDLTPRVMTLFPASKHKLGEDGEFGRSPRAIYRKPKQSSLDAWLVQGSDSSLRHWRIPATNEDIKEQLKFWARAVASTVRQEC